MLVGEGVDYHYHLSDILKKSDTSSKTLDKQPSSFPLSQVRRIIEKKRSERRLDPSSHPADHHASFDKYLNHQVENYHSHKDDFLYYVGQYETSDNDKFVYEVGQTLDNPTHSLRFSSMKQASRLLSGIPLNWPLFVKRTDRHWTYGIIVERTCDEINGELKSVIVSLNGDERRTRIKVLDSTKWEQCLMMINLRTVLVLNTNPNEHDDQTNVSNKALAENDGYVSRSRRRYTGRH